MLMLLPAAALAFSDTVGGNDSSNDEADMMKLVAFEVEEAAVVQELGFAVSSRSANTEVIAALYVRRDGIYELVGEAATTEPEPGQIGWATASGLTWLLEPGETYAMGAWVGDGWNYYYDDGRTDSPWFGGVLGSFRVEENVPQSFRQPETEAYFYWMQIGTLDADADGDGWAASEWGGDDCDDTDPSLGRATDEIPYDGVDQDCDGVDMNDIDHDGEAAVEAGGPDCDDSTPAVAAGNEETCGDGIDNDCDGADLPCAGGGDPEDLGSGPVDISPECGCTSTGAPAGLGLGLALAALAAARRRR